MHLPTKNLLLKKIFLQRCYSSLKSSSQQRADPSNKYRESLCGPPLVRSPFDNPNRRATPITSVLPQFSKNMENKTEQPTTSLPDPENRNPISAPQPIPPVTEVHKTMEEAKKTLDFGNMAAKFKVVRRESTNESQNKEGGGSSEENIPLSVKQYKSIKIGYYIIAGITAAFVIYVFVFYGSPQHDPITGRQIEDQYSGQKWSRFWRTYDWFTSWRTFIAEPSRDKFLPDPVKPPWHQPKYTIVLEMRNVLISPEWSYKKGHYFVKRPALDYFMDVVGYPNFELVIYTSENMMNAAPVVAQIDATNHRINQVLFRDCTKYMNRTHVKDLSRLNRDLSKVIYIDWDPAAFQLNTDNVLRVPKWEGDMKDTYLVDLAELLKTIHLSDVDDVRPILQFYSQFDNPMAEFRRRAQMLAQESAQKQQQSSAAVSTPGAEEPVKKYRGSLFGARRHAI